MESLREDIVAGKLKSGSEIKVMLTIEKPFMFIATLAAFET